MKKLVLLIACLAALAIPAAASAQWLPGSSYFVTENDASSWLEKSFDHAYCEGVPRFGHRGEFPSEEFVVFDCSLKLGAKINCLDVRHKAIKGSRPGYFRLQVARGINGMSCY